MNVRITAEDSVNKIQNYPDLLIISVKAYDTEYAIKKAAHIIGKNTIVLSLQNGLDNIDKIQIIVNQKKIIAGVTTHGAIFNQPGIIQHTGVGKTIIGKLDGRRSADLRHIATMFNDTGIKTKISTDIIREIWIKAIINSSINPLTTLLQCKNGYLLENPILNYLIKQISEESTMVAKKNKILLSMEKMYKATKEVIIDTADNYSSMFQSYQKGKETEIDSINGIIVDLGKKFCINPIINEILLYSIKSICETKE
jgi:2-dehydropantoate 2-reductase